MMMIKKFCVAALLLATNVVAFTPTPRYALNPRAQVLSSPMVLSMAADVADKVREIIATQLGVDVEKVVPSATFVEDLGADSLDTVEIIMAIEEGFDVEIPEEEATNISTVQEVIDFLSKK
jgi:acyl carrier protein